MQALVPLFCTMVCTMILLLVHEIVHLIVSCSRTCHALTYYVSTELEQQKRLNALITESFQPFISVFSFQ